jgi:hypothetical protein
MEKRYDAVDNHMATAQMKAGGERHGLSSKVTGEGV